MALRRILKESQDLLESAPEGVFIDVDPADNFKWKVLVAGPPKTPYEYKLLSLQIEFPLDYPFKPFKILCMNDEPPDLRVAFHPSLSADRPFYLPYLGCTRDDQWHPAMTVRKMLDDFLLPQLSCCVSQEAFLKCFKDFEGPLAPPSTHPQEDPPVCVKTLTGKNLFLGPFPENATVWQLKQQVHDREGIPISDQRLIFRGKQLENHRTLGDYSGLSVCGGGTENPVVHLILRLRCDCTKVKHNWMVKLAEKDWEQFCKLAGAIPGATRRAALRVFLLLEHGRAEPSSEPSSETAKLMLGFQKVLEAKKSKQAQVIERRHMKIEDQDLRRRVLSFL
uniref:Ubiquitin-like domain-containing protein n=1 Tax=Chromera velia CCMP2878 TaxID=1169474 RepID=A0A0G4HD12_9ALVE|eukprot:Cvel_6311.t1-p1 / transcript=Cvel_6311.t1 / gene=Cvel_6311 / organism=Chromera_velia_CCMP2878 / gene_product=Ubiquitin-conjugating enzyme E2 11, putative / transcript_product=Ubiquitin-conjugating enzyme E2 11, putative / location=Cvel_scaffold306:47497-48637(-) / protein_length=335 / sequence_SO=supercontig / SO=protein_coding / is_pseudo=false